MSLSPWKQTKTEQDSIVILPTGGGKSVCYQLPPLLLTATAVVVSPLIGVLVSSIPEFQPCLTIQQH
jgi:ATP-dependent DNA helicase RecQ